MAKVAQRRFTPQVGNIIQAACRTDEQPQLSALRGQGSRHMAADKSRRSCDKGLHAFSLPSAAEFLKTHAVKSSSFNSPAAALKKISAASLGLAVRRMPLRSRNMLSATKAARLLPSTNG